MNERDVRFVNPPELASPPGFSHVAEVTGGRTVYISGQTPLNGAAEIVGAGDLPAQIQQVFENLQAALSAANADFGDVVHLGIFMTDISRIAEVREVRDRYVNTGTPPASTAVEVRRLAQEEFMIEIEAIAVV